MDPTRSVPTPPTDSRRLPDFPPLTLRVATTESGKLVAKSPHVRLSAQAGTRDELRCAVADAVWSVFGYMRLDIPVRLEYADGAVVEFVVGLRRR